MCQYKNVKIVDQILLYRVDFFSAHVGNTGILYLPPTIWNLEYLCQQTPAGGGTGRAIIMLITQELYL